MKRNEEKVKFMVTLGYGGGVKSGLNAEITDQGYIKKREGYNTFGEMVDVLWKINKQNKKIGFTCEYTVILPLKGTKPIYKKTLQNISSQIQQAEERLVERMKVTENTSDGYHTFKELYEFRKLYNAIIFNEWSSQGKYNIHKSKKHFDGEDCFGGGWFIVMATLPAGQISNHYELSDWDLFNCEERERAEKWDGHTAQDVAKRLLASLKEKHDK